MDLAYKYCNKALDLRTDLAEGHTAMGYALSLDKKYEAAEKEFEKSIKLNPNLYDTYYLFARSCFARGEIEKSAELFKKASEVNKEDFQSSNLLEQSLRVLNRIKEAEEVRKESIRRIERQLQLDPTNRRALYMGALSLYSDGQVKKSFDYMNRALELYPDDQGVLTNYACLLARAGKKDQAIEVLENIFGKGYGKKDWIENDPDYDSLRDDPRFQKLLKRL